MKPTKPIGGLLLASNTISGATWTGRGRSPTWLGGRNKNDFLIG
jgi:hypothetical protein